MIDETGLGDRNDHSVQRKELGSGHCCWADLVARPWLGNREKERCSGCYVTETSWTLCATLLGSRAAASGIIA